VARRKSRLLLTHQWLLSLQLHLLPSLPKPLLLLLTPLPRLLRLLAMLPRLQPMPLLLLLTPLLLPSNLASVS